MKWLIIPAFWLLYWFLCFLCTGTDKKNLAGLRSYPDTVQCIVREKLPETAPKPKSLCPILLSNLVFFTALFSAIGQVLKNVVGLSGFPEAFYFFLILGEGLGLFDLLIIDLIWWRNAKRIRFFFLPDKAIYQNPRKHIESFARGILLYAAVVALSAWIVAC